MLEAILISVLATFLVYTILVFIFFYRQLKVVKQKLKDIHILGLKVVKDDYIQFKLLQDAEENVENIEKNGAE